MTLTLREEKDFILYQMKISKFHSIHLSTAGLKQTFTSNFTQLFLHSSFLTSEVRNTSRG